MSSLDPAFSVQDQQSQLVLNLFEGLVVFGPEGGVLRPGVAREWSLSDDGRTCVFHLREDASWSDGVPVTSADFLLAVDRLLRRETGSPLAERLWCVEGAQAYSEAEPEARPAFSTVGVSAPDAHTLVVRLAEPTPHFTWLAATAPLLPVPRHKVQAAPESWWRPPTLVTNGAFVVDEWSPDERVVLTPNPRFHSRDTVHLDRAELRVVRDAATALRMFDAGEVDWVPRNVPRERIIAERRQGWPHMRRELSLCQSLLVPRVDRPPLDDVRLRRALSALIDRRALVESAIQMDHRPATSVVPHAYGLARAVAEAPGAAEGLAALAEAGYPGGAGLPPLRLRHFDAGSHRFVVTTLIDDWKADGVNAVFAEPSEWKAFVADLGSGNFDLAYFSWCADYPDATSHLLPFRSDASENYGRWRDAAFDADLGQALAAGPGSARDAAVIRATERLDAQFAVIPLYRMALHMLLREDVEGFGSHPTGIHLLRYLRRR